MKYFQTAIRLFAALLLIVITAGCQATTDNFVETKLNAEAAAANKIAPKEIAEGVRLDSVSSKGKSIRFSYTMLNYAEGDLDLPVFYKNAKDELIKLANTREDMAFFRKHKIKIAYAYYFKGGEPLSTIIIKAEDYKSK